jgi:Icc protein
MNSKPHFQSFGKNARRVWLVFIMICIAGCTSTSTTPPKDPDTPNTGKPGGTEQINPGNVGGNQFPPTEGVASEESKPFRFVVMGDSRGNSKGANEQTLRTLMDNVKRLSPTPGLILFTGDQVTGGSDVGNQLTAWKDIVDDYFPMTSIYPTLGNHEHNEKVFTEIFTSLPKEQLEGYGKTVYSFDYGNARFITLNTDRQNKDKQYIVDENQRNWLEQQLKTSGKKQVFVQFHLPAYPIGAHLGSSLDGSPSSRDALWSILDRYNVTAVFVGHEHNYNRRQVDSHFDGSGVHFEHTIYQLTIGGAGAPLYSASKENKQVVVGPKASYHFMVVDVEGSKVTFKAYDLQQNEIDSFTVERGGI